MYEYSQEVLQKVSFDRKLFLKELRKSLKWIKKEERTKLKEWSLKTFGAAYRKDILSVFKSSAIQ